MGKTFDEDDPLVVRSDHDDQPNAWIKRVNAALEAAGLAWRFMDDGQPHDGYLLTRLEQTE